MNCELDYSDGDDRTPTLHSLVRAVSLLIAVRIGKRRCGCGGK